MEVIHTMEEDSGITMKELRVDGGASVNNLLMQIQSDTIMKRVVRPGITETTALGAAYLAGLAVGYWESIESLQKQWQVQRAFEPVASRESMEEKIHNWKRAVDRSKNWYTSR